MLLNSEKKIALFNYSVIKLHNYKVKPLHIMLPKKSTCVKSYDRQTKWIYFLIEDDHSLKKYNTIWDKVNTDIKNNLST